MESDQNRLALKWNQTNKESDKNRIRQKWNKTEMKYILWPKGNDPKSE